MPFSKQYIDSTLSKGESLLTFLYKCNLEQFRNHLIFVFTTAQA